MGGLLYFTATDGQNGVELWRSNGTSSGTVMVADIDPGWNGSTPAELEPVGNVLYFTADDGLLGRELWKSNGTSSGTVLVEDVIAGPASSDPVELTAVGGTLFFAVDDGIHGTELWKSTGNGASLVREINSGGSSYASDLTAIGNEVYFAADDGLIGKELCKSDGTYQGTHLVKDVRTDGTASSYPSLFQAGTCRIFSDHRYLHPCPPIHISNFSPDNRRLPPSTRCGNHRSLKQYLPRMNRLS